MLNDIDFDPDAVDDAADTLRFIPVIAADATSIYDIITPPAVRRLDRAAIRRNRLIRSTRHDVARLREAIVAGWDVGPELAHEERRLAALEKEAP